ARRSGARAPAARRKIPVALSRSGRRILPRHRGNRNGEEPMKGHFGVRWQAQRDTAFDGARITESGVALRLPAHSKMRDTRPPMSFRWFLAFTLAFSLQSLAFPSDPVLGEAIECANL